MNPLVIVGIAFFSVFTFFICNLGLKGGGGKLKSILKIILSLGTKPSILRTKP